MSDDRTLTQKIRCPGCFSEKRPAAVCEHCGHNEEAPSLKDTLKVQSTLKEGRYRVGKIVAGSPRQFVTSYLALDLKLGKRCVLQEYFPAGAAARNPIDRSTASVPEQSEAFQFGLERFFEESRHLVGIRHPSLLSVLDHFAARGTAYRVTDFYGGPDLELSLDWAGGRFEQQAAAAIMIRILDGLHALHSKGLLHGDIQPGNIKLVRCSSAALEGLPECLDHLRGRRPLLFGFASAQLALQSRLNQAEQQMATGYAAPERYGRRTAGRNSDIYSCAATLYRMVTGKRPATAQDRLENGSGDLLPAPRKLCRRISPNFESVLLDGLAIDPASRPASAQQFRRMLMEASGLSIPDQACQAASQSQTEQAQPTSGTTQKAANDFSPAHPTQACRPKLSKAPPKTPTKPARSSSTPNLIYFSCVALLILIIILVISRSSV